MKMNNENLNKKQKSIQRSEALENQIETMLDDIMKEEDGDEINFRFCDDESSSENESEDLLICLPEENEKETPNFIIDMSQSDIDIKNNNLFPIQRSDKKYSTVSFQGEENFQNFDNFNNYINNKNNFSLFSPNFKIPNNNINNINYQNPKSSFYQNNLINQRTSFSSTNYSINTFSRDDKRRKTYELNEDECILENNYINLNINPNNSMYNDLTSYNHLNMNQNPNPINQNNFFFINNKNINLQQIGRNNNSLRLLNNNQIKDNNNSLCNISTVFLNNQNDFNVNINNNQCHKKFFTTSVPQSTNMHIEMLLYELNLSLTKNEKIDYFIYNKLQGNFVNIIKTHRGSRIFQNYLKNTHGDIIHQIFNEISPSLIELITDPYANYFCKRFFNFLNQKDRIDFLLSINSALTKLSINNIGTYPIQGIIEQIGCKNEKKIIINSLKDSISELCYDTYGTHVLEKIISCFEEEFTGFIFDYVEKNFLNLSNHINGICIVKKILSLTHKKEIHDKLKKIINENAFNLIQHPYANYVIQIIIETWEINEILEILSNFHNKFTILSMSKYSSNVVERCIEKSPIILREYINEICENGRIAEIMKNNFGNYVIQKALKISIKNDKKKLAEEVERNIFKLNDKKLILKWKSIVSPHLDNKNSQDKNSII
jgi:hypothetical protein